MRSMFSAISGLKSFQTSMDVVGSNIANVNTPGYKASRVVFQTALSQLLKSARSPAGGLGGINPIQIGLGSRIAAIDKMMTQGSFQSTGKKTDLAIQGDGFFIVTDGIRKYYTRAGNFDLDSNGNLIQTSTGLKVMGWKAQLDPSTGRRFVDTNLPISELVVKAGMTLPAKKTTQTKFGGNMKSDVGFKNFEITLTDDSGNKHDVKVSFKRAEGIKISGTDSPFDSEQQYTFEIDASPYEGTKGRVVLDKFGNVVTSGFDVLDSGIDDTNDSTGNRDIDFNGPLTGNFIIYAYDGTNKAATAVTLDNAESIDTTGDLNSVDNKTNVVWKAIPIKSTTAVEDNTTTGTDIDNTNGEITLSKPYTGVYTIVLKDSSNNVLDVKTVTLNGDNKISFDTSIGPVNSFELYENANSITVGNNAELVATNSGMFKFYEADDPTNFIVPDYQTPLYSTSVQVYDTLGNAYQVYFDFVKLGYIDDDHKNVWIWRARIPTGEDITYMRDETTDVANAKGGVINFDETGRVKDYGSISDNLISNIDWNAGVKYIKFDAGESGDSTVKIKVDLNELTQYSGEFSAAVDYQDGYPLGTLESFAINEYGEIVGTFSNGITDTLGKIALAVFNNPAGLTDMGKSLYVESANSGIAKIGEVGSGGRGTLIPGALEMSNVDLAEEFTKMIVAQRGFQANARVITTSDQILNELVNIKR